MSVAPPIHEGALQYVLWVAHHHFGCVKANPHSAVEQDLQIVGEDVDDFARKLAERYGEWVYQWPWQRFSELNEGLPIFFPFSLIHQLVTWPIRGRFSRQSTFERLELGHVATVLDAGEWIEP